MERCTIRKTSCRSKAGEKAATNGSKGLYAFLGEIIFEDICGASTGEMFEAVHNMFAFAVII